MATHNTPVGATATPSETAPTGATTRAKMKVTTRQCEVLRYARLEMTDKQIAVAMRIKPSSVATHWRDIYARLGVRRRAAALCRCYELGILK